MLWLSSASDHAKDAPPQSDPRGHQGDAQSGDGGDAAGACVYGGKTYASGSSWVGMCDTVNCFCEDGVVACDYMCTANTHFACGAGAGQVTCDASSHYCSLASAPPDSGSSVLGSCQPIPSACAGGGTTCSCIVEYGGEGVCSISDGGIGIIVVAGE
jgi:hypothetical protein